jgi:hypothetical protein
MHNRDVLPSFRYTKNLSSDKINISTFKGEGELTNLQLDENVLTELLELPSWLKLTSAWCNHISFRISWAKLKSVPITLSLDEVNISVETCELARSGTPTANSGTAGGGLQSLPMPMGKYSFIHKVIDGITIVVNTVNVNFKSPAFTASVQVRSVSLYVHVQQSCSFCHIFRCHEFVSNHEHQSGRRPNCASLD